jgi:hypothetical protein
MADGRLWLTAMPPCDDLLMLEIRRPFGGVFKGFYDEKGLRTRLSAPSDRITLVALRDILQFSRQPFLRPRDPSLGEPLWLHL